MFQKSLIIIILIPILNTSPTIRQKSVNEYLDHSGYPNHGDHPEHIYHYDEHPDLPNSHFEHQVSK